MEFVGLTVFLILPLLFVILAFNQVQKATFAAEAAVVSAQRTLSKFPTAAGLQQARQAAALAAADQGFQGSDFTYDLQCHSPRCPAPTARATLRISLQPSLPLLPAFLQDLALSSLRIESQREITWGRYGA